MVGVRNLAIFYIQIQVPLRINRKRTLVRKASSELHKVVQTMVRLIKIDDGQLECYNIFCLKQFVHFCLEIKLYLMFWTNF